ncbi:MAG: hypothetical protein QGH59_01665, partial [Gemmatimonadota bacterium]|nr:hypothetical protein [Gemmatimonadota bacterium]
MGQKTPLLDTVCEFAFPRFAGTEGERRAGEMVAERLRAAGLEVTREPIRVSRSAYPNLRALAHGLGALGVVVLAATATTGNPLPGVFLAAALLAALLGGAKWHRSLEGIFDTGSMVDSANFTARRPGRGGRP